MVIMCQYKNNCRKFIINEINTSACLRLCSRNPLLNYEIADSFMPKRKLSAEEKELEENNEVSPLKIIKENEGFSITDIKKQIADIEKNTDLPRKRKADLVQNILIKKGIIKSTDIEELDTLDHPAPQSAPLSESLVETDKKKREMKEVSDVVKDNLIKETDVTGGWKYPKRQKRKMRKMKKR